MKKTLLVAVSVLGACRAEGGNPPVKTAPTPAKIVEAPAAPAKKQTDVSAQDYAMPALPKTRLTLTDAFKGAHVLNVEVAATHDARTRGLMWRTALADGEGMVFLFPEETALSFWMRNTLIPLDMIFIDAQFRIVGIVENAEPQTLSSRSPGKDAKYVLEVPAGYSEKIGLKAGLPVKIEGLSGFPVEN